MGNPSAAQEPSMEEILASIRQIISEDGDPHFAGRADEADEAEEPADGASEIRSERVAPSAPFQGGSMKVGSARSAAASAAAPTVAETASPDFSAAPKSRAVSTQHAVNGASGHRLLSDGADTAVSGAFSALAHTILAQNARTLEDLVTEMLQPMLREWLDDNLPTLVERIVQDEIQRVSRGRR